MRPRKWTDTDLANIVENSYSLADVIRGLGLKPAGGNYTQIKKSIIRCKLDTSHFDLKKSSNNIGKPRVKKSIDHYLVKGKAVNYNLRKRILDEGLKEWKCEECGNSTWNGHKIPLQLHHINGDREDNRLSNLQMLCPNCHALTKNYCGRGKKKDIAYKKSDKEYYCIGCGSLISKRALRCVECSHINAIKVERPNIPQLKKELEKSNYTAMGRKYGVSANAVKKWIS